MTLQSPKNQLLTHWTFGRYVDEDGQTAWLGIFYTISGKPAKRPLILPMADIEKPKTVWQQLMNAGADMSFIHDKQKLEGLLTPDNLIQGIFARKLGWVGERFLTAAAVSLIGGHDVVVEPAILDIATRLFGRAGTKSDWKNSVALLAKKSSFCALALLQALAAPLLILVFPNGDEGFLFNLAGDSSVGKTACLMVGKSVSGSGNELSTWDQTARSLVEHAAAFSDTYMPIDDLDKVSNERGFARDFTRITHTLTSGESRQYAAMVKGNLPDLRWTFCGMTGSRTTVEELSGTTNRENHERVRCLDLKVPSAAEGGIWDRRDAGDVPQQLTDELKAACCRAYGLPLRRWLKELHKEGTVKQAGELVRQWVARQGLAEADAIGHRVAKKFGLLHAAGILAIRAKILPWDDAFVDDVVGRMHANARETLYPHEKEVREGLRSIVTEAKPLAAKPLSTSNRPELRSARRAEMFVRKGASKTLHMTIDRFEGCFATRAAAELALKQLEEAKVFRRDKNGKATRQLRVRVAGEEKKLRYLELKLSGLKAQAASPATRTPQRP